MNIEAAGSQSSFSGTVSLTKKICSVTGKRKSQSSFSGTVSLTIDPVAKAIAGSLSPHLVERYL